MKLSRTHFPLDELALEVSRRAAPVAQARGIELQTHGGTTVEIYGDFNRLENALLNLVDNALKYSEAGSTVTLETGEDSGQGWIEVSDHGTGIAVDQLALVGRRFYRPEEWIETGEQRRGSGLGLSIARRIAELHGGTLSVSSAPGTGTHVRISLPRASEDTRG
jgi:signal transduction histidine kinase